MVERLGCIFELWSDGILMQIHVHETPQTGPAPALVSHLGQLYFVTKIRAETLPQCQWGEGYSDYQLVHSVEAGVGPDWSPARGVETRNTMDRCPGRGSSIDLIIAWMFIFCRPQHQQPASRPHIAYFKSSHPLKPNTQIHIPMFLFSNDFDSWTGVMKPSQAHYTRH